MTRALIVFLAVVAAGQPLRADSPQQSFVKHWEGRAVVVTDALYSLVYNERGRLGTSKNGRREGLSVVSPSGGAWLQFDGRQGRDVVVEPDPRKVIAAVNTAYQPDALDVRSYRKLEALSVARYDPGVELFVTGVRVERDEVRIALAAAPGGDAVTGLRLKWPTPFSPSFDERDVIESRIRQFVQVARP